jgi:hypothetical protein
MDRRSNRRTITRPAKRFLGCERGAVLVEFAMVLPMMLIFFAIIIEGARLMWSYQTAIEGVRDATRYLARVTPANICATSGSVTGWSGKLTQIVSTTISDQSVQSVFPKDVSVISVTPSYSCNAGDFRNSPVAIGQVSAQIQIDFPFASLFRLVGSSPDRLQTTLTDQSRIYGS